MIEFEHNGLVYYAAEGKNGYPDVQYKLSSGKMVSTGSLPVVIKAIEVLNNAKVSA